MAEGRQGKTIEQVLDEFLDEQEARWSPATYRRYETVVNLLKASMERYWPGHEGEGGKVTKAGGPTAAPTAPRTSRGRSACSSTTSCRTR